MTPNPKPMSCFIIVWGLIKHFLHDRWEERETESLIQSTYKSWNSMHSKVVLRSMIESNAHHLRWIRHTPIGSSYMLDEIEVLLYTIITILMYVYESLYFIVHWLDYHKIWTITKSTVGYNSNIHYSLMYRQYHGPTLNAYPMYHKG